MNKNIYNYKKQNKIKTKEGILHGNTRILR